MVGFTKSILAITAAVAIVRAHPAPYVEPIFFENRRPSRKIYVISTRSWLRHGTDEDAEMLKLAP